MSEEPEVSPLRLKRPGAGGPPASPQAPATPPVAADAPPPAPAPATPVPAPEPPLAPLGGAPTPSPAPAANRDAASPERLRRRPSLAAEAPAAPLPTAHPEPAPPRAAAPEPADAPPVPAAPPVFKLKVGAKPPPPPPPLPSAEPDAKAEALRALEQPTSEAPLLPLPGLGPTTAAAGMPFAPPAPAEGVPAGEPAGGAPLSPLSRVPIHLRAEGPAEALDPSKLPPPLPARAARAAVGRNHARRDAMLFGLVFILVVGAGAGAYFYFSKPEAAKETAAEARERISAAARLPGKTVDEARQGLAGARDKEQARVDAVPSGKETPEARAVGNVTPAELQAKLREQNSPTPSPDPAAAASAPVQTVTAYAGEKTAPAAPAAPAIPDPVPPSARLLRYAESIRVSGVFQGSPARALIDGRLVREGELAESTLGIKFAALDPQAKQLILEEPGGARVRVKY